MSKLFDFENQFILRLPEELASKIHKALSTDPKIPLPNMEITPYISQTDIEGRNLETLRFKLSIEKTELEGVLLDLPCLIESQKTLDSLNFFKSNDISQMISFQPTEELKRVGFKACEATNRRYLRLLASDGITGPAKNIRKRFFRKKVKIDKGSVREVEGTLNEIIKDLSKQKNNTTSDHHIEENSKKMKRKYKRKF